MSRFHERKLIEKSDPHLLETPSRFQTYGNSNLNLFRIEMALKYLSGIDNDNKLFYSRLQSSCIVMSYEQS